MEIYTCTWTFCTYGYTYLGFLCLWIYILGLSVSMDIIYLGFLCDIHMYILGLSVPMDYMWAFHAYGLYVGFPCLWIILGLGGCAISPYIMREREKKVVLERTKEY